MHSSSLGRVYFPAMGLYPKLNQSSRFLLVCSKYNKMFFFGLDETVELTCFLSSHSSSREHDTLVAPFLARNKLLQENGLACVFSPVCPAPRPHIALTLAYHPSRGIPLARVDAALRELEVASWDAAVSTPACVF